MSCSMKAIVDTDLGKFVLAVLSVLFDTVNSSSLTFEFFLRHENFQKPQMFVLKTYPLIAEIMMM